MNKERRRNYLEPRGIAVWTGDTRDTLRQEEIILAGRLYSMGNIDAGGDHFSRRGRKVLRDVLRDTVPTTRSNAIRGGPAHMKVMREVLKRAGSDMRMRHPVHGFRLTPLARELEGAIRECRAEFRKQPRMSRERFWEVAGVANAAIGEALRRQDGRGRTEEGQE